MDEFLAPFPLDQGLGLPLGATLIVTGFPTTAPIPFDLDEGLELTNVVALTFTPSTTDADGDLLEDSWEELFFGDIGVISGQDTHPDTGNTYLEYQSAGADPRSGNLETPPIDLSNFTAEITKENGQLYVNFPFPDVSLAQVDITLKSSSILAPSDFKDVTPQPNLENLGQNQHRIALPPTEISMPKNFFIVSISLKTP